MAHPEAAASRARAERPVRMVEEGAPEAAATAAETAQLGAQTLFNQMSTASRIGQENLDQLISAQGALVSAVSETLQRLSTLGLDLVKDGSSHWAGLSEQRSVSDLTTAQLVAWRNLFDRSLGEAKALGDIAVRTAEVTVGAWAAAIDRMNAEQR